MSSPDPKAVASMITLAPTIFLSGTGSGRSRYSTPGRFLLGSSGAIRPPPGRSATSAMFLLLKSPITPPRHTSAMLRRCQSQTDWAHPRAATWTKPSRLRGLGDNSNQPAVIQGSPTPVTPRACWVSPRSTARERCASCGWVGAKVVENTYEERRGMPQPINLYYWPTPNGKKVALFLEEAGVPDELGPIDITAGGQFDEEFLRGRARGRPRAARRPRNERRGPEEK